ncbi:MAG: tetratricopeptide repeat protein, partial [Leptolyngbyaceae cyanobacterium bins.59]|nr:tetratricopeptide repeat protein [Leptolyngbyaceae cyanobacterium bins.59]
GVPQSDFFAVARTLVHLLSGRHPTQLPVHEAGQLLWRTQAPQVSKPFADLIDELQAPAWRKRPADTETILNRLDRLPRQLRRHQVLLSLQFRWAIGISSVLVGVSSIWTLHALAAYQQRSQAQHFAEQGAQQQLTGQIDAAWRNYQNALNLDPTLLVAHHNLALLCQGEGNLSCATEHYQRVLRLDPHHWQTYYNLGNLYDEQGQFKKAAEYYRKVISGADLPLKVDAANNLSRLYNLEGQYQKAAQVASPLLPQVQDPLSQAALLKNIGWANLGLRQYDTAWKSLNQAKQFDPQRADIYCLLAQTQEARGIAQGIKQFQKDCLQYETTSALPEVRQWRSRILDRVL